MRDRLRRAGVPLLIATLLGVVAVGLLTRPAGVGDRAYELEQRLRCPVCKTVSVAESPSETAAAMRQEIQQQVDAGDTDEEVLDYFRARYGAWVVLDPPVRGPTMLVWLIPVAALAVGIAALAVVPRRGVLAPPLPQEERERVRQEMALFADRSTRDDEP